MEELLKPTRVEPLYGNNILDNISKLLTNNKLHIKEEAIKESPWNVYLAKIGAWLTSLIG